MENDQTCDAIISLVGLTALVSGHRELISLRLALPCPRADTHRLLHCFYRLPFLLYFVFFFFFFFFFFLTFYDRYCAILFFPDFIDLLYLFFCFS